MAKYGANSIGFVLADGFNLVPSVLTSLDGPAIESILKETTGLGDSWPVNTAVGVRKGSLSVGGYFDDATTGIIASLLPDGGANTPVRAMSINVTGNTLGAKFIGMAGVLGGKFRRVAENGGLVLASAEYTVSGEVEQDGLILFPLQAVTVDTNSEGANSQDNGALSSNGGAGYVHVLAYSGFTNIVVKIRHSVDDATYADLLTFNTTFTANGGERKAVTGTVNRHLAVDINVTGAGSASIFVGFKRN